MKQQVVLLTGGSSGIGLAMAQALCAQGYVVYAASRRGTTEQSDARSGGCIRSLCMDVTLESSVQQGVQQIIESQGRLDVLLCNAGNGIAGSVEDTTDAETRFQFETNFFGAANVLRACLPWFRKQRSGKIVVTSSVAAMAPIPFQSLYSASKAALLLYTEALRLEMAPYGVQCSCLLPGDTRTGFTDARKYTLGAQNAASPYRAAMQRAVSKMERDERGGMAAAKVAQAVVKQLQRRTMSPHIVPGWDYKLLCFLMDVLPVRLKLFILSKMY